MFKYLLFALSITLCLLPSAYAEAIRILVVPGHDDESIGSSFGGKTEVELNRIVAEKLVLKLRTGMNAEVVYAHDGVGYAPFLQNYFEKFKKEIIKFRDDHARSWKRAIKRGKVDVSLDNVAHANATSSVVERLYGINKWANENNIDLVVHIHFNDYGSRNRSQVGEYAGFSVYVPERQFRVGEQSIAIGNSVHHALSRVLFPSNFPSEKKYNGAIEDQELIATGAYDTLDAPSILVEYAYIYEPIVQSNFFNTVADVLAHATYQGVNSYFNIPMFGEDLLPPYTWVNDRKENIKSKPLEDVYMLQLALKLDGSYPPMGKTSDDCPITGIFGPCTTKALKAFQSRYGISATGSLGPQTRTFLNVIY